MAEREVAADAEDAEGWLVAGLAVSVPAGVGPGHGFVVGDAEGDVMGVGRVLAVVGDNGRTGCLYGRWLVRLLRAGCANDGGGDGGQSGKS